MPISVHISNNEGETWNKEPVFMDSHFHFAIEKLTARVLRSDDYSILYKIDPYDDIAFKQNELPILLKELKIYRE